MNRLKAAIGSVTSRGESAAKANDADKVEASGTTASVEKQEQPKGSAGELRTRRRIL